MISTGLKVTNSAVKSGEVVLYKASQFDIDDINKKADMLDTKRSYLFKTGLIFSDYDFTEECKSVLESIPNVYTDADNLNKAITNILNNVNNLRVTSTQIKNLAVYLVGWFKATKASTGLSKTSIISVLMWLKNYYFVIDLESVWIPGSTLNKTSALFLNVLANLFGVTVYVLGDNNCEQLFKKANISYRVLSDRPDFDSWLRTVKSCSYMFYPVERTYSKDLDTLLLQADSNLKIGAFIFGYDQSRYVEIHNTFVNLTEFMGGESLQSKIQSEIESAERNSFGNKQVLDDIKLGFEQKTLSELMELSDSTKRLEVERASYFYSEKITNKKYRESFRYTIETLFNRCNANIRQLYTVCITVVAMLNTSKLESYGDNILYYNTKQLSMSECAWLFIKCSVTNRVVIFDVTKSRLYDLMSHLGEKESNTNLAFDPNSVAVSKNIFSLIEFDEVGSGDAIVVPSGIIKTKIKTVASKAQDKMNEMLYSDNVIAQNKNITDIEVQILSSTLEEIPIIWGANNEARPGFKLEDRGRKAFISTLLANVVGVDDDKQAYTARIRQLVENKNSVIFMNNKHFEDFASGAACDFSGGSGVGSLGAGWSPVGGGGGSYRKACYNNSSGGQGVVLNDNPTECDHTYKLLSENMQRSTKLRDREGLFRQWKFRVLSYNIQTFIADKIDLICSQAETDLVNVSLDVILNAVANLPNDVVVKLMSYTYKFSDIAPKIVVLATGSFTLTALDCMTLYFCSLCGFDVVVFASNGYRSLDGFMRDNIFDQHICGNISFDYAYGNIENPRRGLFSSLFS